MCLNVLFLLLLLSQVALVNEVLNPNVFTWITKGSN